MQTSVSKRSMAYSQRTFNETLARGHRSETTSIRRRGGIRACNRSGRRLFVFKGSTAKRAPVNTATTVTSATAVKQRRMPTATTELDNELAVRGNVIFASTVADDESSPKHARSLSSICDKRMPSITRRLRSRSAVRSNHLNSERRSEVGSPSGLRKSSAVEDVSPAEGAVVNNDSNSTKNMTVEYLIPPDNPTESNSVKTEESKLISSPSNVSTASDNEDEDDDDDDDDNNKNNNNNNNDYDQSNDKKPSPNVTIRMPISPAVVGYRKIVYDESHNGWIEYWKVEEDWKKARQRQKREITRAKMARDLANAIPAPARKVKGRSTARLQLMFPTAIVRGDRKRGFTHNITLTDPLRIELHKRKAPIVPTYFQRHILQYGKLPFRNNPRPHPVV